MRRGNSTVCSKEWGKRILQGSGGGDTKIPYEKNNEKALLKLIKEGLAYISDGSPSIMQYAYDWSYEESPDFEPVGLDIQIMLTWSPTDAMAEEVETYINSDYHESYAITPVTTLLLTPDTDTPFSMNNFRNSSPSGSAASTLLQITFNPKRKELIDDTCHRKDGVRYRSRRFAGKQVQPEQPAFCFKQAGENCELYK